MRALVLGGNGFVGSHFVRSLLDRTYQVRTLDTDESALVSIPAECEQLFGSYADDKLMRQALKDVNVVYQLAGVLGSAELTAPGQPERALAINVVAYVKFLELCCELGVKSVFFPTKPTDAVNVYSITKQASERFSELYSRYRGLNVRVLRWLNVFGPGEKAYPVRKIVPTFVIQAIEGRAIEVFGAGNQFIELVYGKDVAETAVDYMSLPWSKEFLTPMDGGCGHRLRVIDLAELIRGLTGGTSEIFKVPVPDADPGMWAARENVWSFTHKVHWTPLEQALSETIEFYRQHESYRKACVDVMYGIEAGPNNLTMNARKAIEPSPVKV